MQLEQRSWGLVVIEVRGGALDTYYGKGVEHHVHCSRPQIMNQHDCKMQANFHYMRQMLVLQERFVVADQQNMDRIPGSAGKFNFHQKQILRPLSSIY